MDEKYKAILDRWASSVIGEKLKKPYVHILFGARQTGKSTLLKALLPADTTNVNLADPAERSRHLSDKSEFAKICRSLPKKKRPQFVFVDEAQSVPSIFDAVQYLYDEDKTRWRFVLCGSSARKLRKTGANLLPGRSMLHHLYPLTLLERPAPIGLAASGEFRPVRFSWKGKKNPPALFPAADLLERLAFGELPGVVTAEPNDRGDLLRSYALIHLEEEIRREALVKDWGSFVRFLNLAAAESGQILNYAGISQESGISQPTVKAYYQLLEDMFIGFSVPAYSKSARKKLLSTPKFLFFDSGVRHAAQGLLPSVEIVKTDPGRFFEQWVGLELWKRLQYLGQGRLYHQRTKDGAEIDFIVELGGRLIPIEVKWTDRPSLTDARHMRAFLAENRAASNHGLVVCRAPRPLQLDDHITAIPWFCL